MTSAELAVFPCKHCGKTFSDGRSLGGHVRQAHPQPKPAAPQASQASQASPAALGEGEVAAQVLEQWKSGTDPLTVISSLRVHPRFVKEVLQEYDELLNEWKKFKEAKEA
jgi:hypothetical protein